MNEKGFVLTETIIVSVFIVTIFTFVFSSVFPLIGKYEDMSDREENIDILYKLYNIRKMINNDTYKTTLLDMDIKRLSCTDFDNEEECNILMSYLNLDNYILVYANGIRDNYDILCNINTEIANYIEDYKTENRKTLILLDVNSYTIAHVDMHDNNMNAYFAIKNNILKSRCSSSTIEEGVTYLSGDNDCVNFNYVWYSGKMWRITAVYPDKSIKMITENAITTIPFGNNNEFYTNETEKSYAYQWLNEDFLDTLTDYQKLLALKQDDKRWNTAAPLGTRLNGTNFVTAYVGLMNNYEYHLSYKTLGENVSNSANSFLNKTNNRSKESWYLLHPTTTDGTEGIGLRPMVYLKPNVNFSSGVGTFENPFTILGDLKKAKSGERINTRMSGEYLKFDTQQNAQTYRIISVDENLGNKYAKVIANYYANNNDAKKIAYGLEYGSTNAPSSPASYWDNYLSNNYLSRLINTYGNNPFTNGYYYLGLANSSACYKEAICLSYNPYIKVANCIKTDAKSLSIGLARFGEMFATTLTTYDLNKQGINNYASWLITTFSKNNSTSYYRYIDSSGCVKGADGINANTMRVRPTLYLKYTAKIVSGSGTPTDPYIVTS